MHQSRNISSDADDHLVAKKTLLEENNYSVYNTGCPTISVTSDTPLIFAIHARIPISFYVLKDEGLGFYFFERNVEIFFPVIIRSRYKLSQVFRLSPVCSKFKFKFFAGIQLFGLKTTSHGKPDLKK